VQHSELIAYFEGKARSHKDIRHGAAYPDAPELKRRSFFRMNSEQELQQAIPVQVDYPAMLLPVYHGRLKADRGMVSDIISASFEIRMHAEPLDFAGIEAARDRCKAICMQIIASMLQEIEDYGACGPIEQLDPGSVSYDFTGPINQHEYGCLCRFEIEDTAFNPVTADLSNVFR
jgi:hypothetical protein